MTCGLFNGCGGDLFLQCSKHIVLFCWCFSHCFGRPLKTRQVKAPFLNALVQILSSIFTKKSRINPTFCLVGGEIGIWTLGTGEGTHDFESCAFDLSAISPDTVPEGVEPSFSDRKSDVLPLHQGTIKVGVPDSNWWTLDPQSSALNLSANLHMYKRTWWESNPWSRFCRPLP